jgi:hypothetical protein
LDLSNNFSHSIDNIPPSVIHLSFWGHHSFKNCIPVNVEYLTIKFVEYEEDEEEIDNYIDNIPYHIKEINIYSQYDKKFLKKIPFGCKITVK